MASNTPAIKTETTPATPVTGIWDTTFPLFHRLSREIDTMFERFGMERPVFEQTASGWNPAMEVSTKNNEFCMKVDVPGMKREDVSVEVDDHHVVLRGERKQEKEEKKDGYFKSERSYGSFYRAVTLPEGVKPELAKAAMHDGVLTITMPMTKVEETMRKLEIGEPAPAKTIKAA
ncbi:MAG: Hsp20/alpha crystallin family protein [Vicinamibacterales bacterium]